MIIVKIELKSAIHDSRSRQLGEMHIANDETGGLVLRNYNGVVLRKPHFTTPTRLGRVTDHNAEAEVIWVLVAKMLKSMGYST